MELKKPDQQICPSGVIRVKQGETRSWRGKGEVEFENLRVI